MGFTGFSDRAVAAHLTQLLPYPWVLPRTVTPLITAPILQCGITVLFTAVTHRTAPIRFSGRHRPTDRTRVAISQDRAAGKMRHTGLRPPCGERVYQQKVLPRSLLSHRVEFSSRDGPSGHTRERERERGVLISGLHMMARYSQREHRVRDNDNPALGCTYSTPG